MTQPVNLLLVDDHAPNLDVLAAILDSPDYRLVRAQSAQQALLALLDSDFAVIVLDIQMPEVGGIELASIIKQRKRSRDIPILFLTAFQVDEQDILRGYGAGAVDYLTKPVHADILRSKISVFVDLYRKTRALAISNQALSIEMAERLRAQQALSEANNELERRVEQRTAELELAARNESLARADAERQGKLKEDFLAVVSHELRTPLNAIYGWTKILASQGKTPEVLAKGLAVIERNARSQAQLIEDLLDMSSITSGKARLDSSEVNLVDVIEAAVNAIRPAAQRAGVRVQTAWQPTQSAQHRSMVWGDAGRLQQVIGNLLSNAVTFTQENGKVTVHISRNDERARVEVRDTGEGISEEFLPHVFDKFRQADGSSTRQHRGLGLGLAIVKNLTELHGGRVHASSSGTGLGSTFTVELPLMQTGAYARVASNTDAAESGVEAIGNVAPNLAGLRILAVDDEADAREMLSQLLGQQRASVKTAASAMEAFETLSRESFDLVISDIGMPGDDGYSLIRRLRELEGTSRHTPAIACTAFARHDDRRRSLDEGFDEHVCKPLEPRLLLAVAARLIGRTSEPAADGRPLQSAH